MKARFSDIKGFPRTLIRAINCFEGSPVCKVKEQIFLYPNIPWCFVYPSMELKKSIFAFIGYVVNMSGQKGLICLVVLLAETSRGV